MSTRLRVATLGLSLAALVGAALVAYSILTLVGILPSLPPPSHGLTAADLASLAVAGATLLLAAFTFLLALTTNAALDLAKAERSVAERTLAEVQAQTAKFAEQVEATNRQALAAEQALGFSWRPMLVDVPEGLRVRTSAYVGTTDEAEVTVWRDPMSAMRLVVIALRNIGAGPAFISKAGLSAGVVGVWLTDASSLVVARDETVRLEFHFDSGAGVQETAVDTSLQSGNDFRISVWYSDLGGREWRTWAHVHLFNRWTVEKVEVFDGDAIEPFARTGAGLS